MLIPLPKPEQVINALLNGEKLIMETRSDRVKKVVTAKDVNLAQTQDSMIFFYTLGISDYQFEELQKTYHRHQNSFEEIMPLLQHDSKELKLVEDLIITLNTAHSLVTEWYQLHDQKGD